MIEAELTFLEVEIERLAVHTKELRETHLGQSPEVLYTVDARLPARELVLSMVHAIVLPIVKVDEAVVSAPSRLNGRHYPTLLSS